MPRIRILFKLCIFFVLNSMYGLHLYSLIMKVRGQIALYRGGSIIFGLSDFPVSEFELVAEELLMSDSTIKAS